MGKLTLKPTEATFARGDDDLIVPLKNATADELQMIVEVLRKKKSCKLEADCNDPMEIANELQLMGGNSIANTGRGHGVVYAEIVDDVASLIKAKPDKGATIIDKEDAIVKKLICDVEEKMKFEERAAFVKEMEIITGKAGWKSIANAIQNQAIWTALRLPILEHLVVFVARQLGVQIAQKVVMSRMMTSLAGPIGLAIGAVWAMIDFAGPANTATVPSVLIVTMIRARLRQEDIEKAALEIDPDGVNNDF